MSTIISNTHGSEANAVNVVGSILEIAGILFFAKYVLAVLSWVWLYFLRPNTNLAKYGASHSAERRAWSFVTGATEGVGLGFARVLAEKGFNVVLLSRRERELNQVAEQLQKDFGVQTLVVVADASSNEEKAFEEIVGKVKDLDLGILVNNVGLNTRIPTALRDNTVAEIDRMIDINARFPTKLTRCLIPILAQRCVNGQRAAIVNVSSISMCLPGALLAVYAATKSYNNILSRSLSAELQPLSIDCLAVTPGYVLSQSNPIKERSCMVVTAETHARAALGKIGYAMTVNAVWSHSLMELATILPESMLGQIVRKQMVDLRKKMQEDDAKAQHA